MDQKPGWTPTERLLFVAVVPLVVVFSVVLLLGLGASGKDDQTASPAAENVSVTPATLAARARDKARQEQRDAYRECLKSMGGNFGRPAFRSRFSSRPDMGKMRNAMGVCQTILRNGGGPVPSSQQHAATPNSL